MKSNHHHQHIVLYINIYDQILQAKQKIQMKYIFIYAFIICIFKIGKNKPKILPLLFVVLINNNNDDDDDDDDDDNHNI